MSQREILQNKFFSLKEAYDFRHNYAPMQLMLLPEHSWFFPPASSEPSHYHVGHVRRCMAMHHVGPHRHTLWAPAGISALLQLLTGSTEFKFVTAKKSWRVQLGTQNKLAKPTSSKWTMSVRQDGALKQWHLHMPSGCSEQLTGHCIWLLTTSLLPVLTAQHITCCVFSRDKNKAGHSAVSGWIARSSKSSARPSARLEALPAGAWGASLRAAPALTWACKPPQSHLGLSSAFSAFSKPCLHAGSVPPPGWEGPQGCPSRTIAGLWGPLCCLGAIFRLPGASAPARFVTPQPFSHIFSLSLTWYLQISHLKGASCRLPPGCRQAFFPLHVSELPRCHLCTGCRFQAASAMSSLQATSELLLFLFCCLP